MRAVNTVPVPWDGKQTTPRRKHSTSPLRREKIDARRKHSPSPLRRKKYDARRNHNTSPLRRKKSMRAVSTVPVP